MDSRVGPDAHSLPDVLLRRGTGDRVELRLGVSCEAGGPVDETVADVLTRHGIWECCRFAARYRSQFGEQPSQTLHRSRA